MRRGLFEHGGGVTPPDGTHRRAAHRFPQLRAEKIGASAAAPIYESSLALGAGDFGPAFDANLKFGGGFPSVQDLTMTPAGRLVLADDNRNAIRFIW